jgi:hypothetical protein
MRTALAGVGVLFVLLAAPLAHANDKIASREVAKPADGVEATANPSTDAKAVPTSGSLSLALAVAKDLARPLPPPPITLTLKVDLSAQRVTVLERGKVKHTWVISSGREGYATQTGTFQPQWAAKMWYSRQWDMAPMPHAVFFNKGTAFHATNATGALGRPASGGCIRLAPGNAAALYALVHRHGYASTKVVVHGTPREQAIARRKGNSQGYYQQAYASQGPYNGYQGRSRNQRPNRGSPSPWGF